MSAGKHTEGPWRVEVGTTLVWGACNADDPSARGMGYPVAECRITPAGLWAEGPDASEGEANARLIVRAVNRDALFNEAVEALEECRKTLAMLAEPKEIRSTTVTHAWGQAIAAERKARVALSKIKATQASEDE